MLLYLAAACCGVSVGLFAFLIRKPPRYAAHEHAAARARDRRNRQRRQMDRDLRWLIR